MVGWHHGSDGHEFEQTQEDSERQGSLLCYSPWGRKESDTTERLNSKILSDKETFLDHVRTKRTKPQNMWH